VMYKRNERTNLIEFDRLIDLFPGEVRPLMKNGEPVGFKWLPGAFNSAAGLEEFGEAKGRVFRPKALWTTFDSEFGNPFGDSLLRRAFSPWFEKWMEKGGIDLRRLRFIKDAWVGMVMGYPVRSKLELPDGTQVTGRDIAREATEVFMSGGTLTLPTDRDDAGNRMFELTNPTDTSQGATTILEYVDKLDVEIWKGEDLPREVIEAADTGSGFSGRAIPFVAFLAILQGEGQELKVSVVRDILEPLVHLNFGEQEFELTLMSLVDKVTEQMAAQPGPLGTEQGPPQQPGQAQFSHESNGHGTLQFKERARAPVGGVSIGGKQFRGGEFIPSEVLEQATPAERRAVESPKEEKPKPKAKKPSGKQAGKPTGKVSPARLKKQVKTKEFKQWFGNSKAVDEKGNPKVIFHGTQFDFDTFDKDKVGQSLDPGDWGHGFYFGNEKQADFSGLPSAKPILSRATPASAIFNLFGFFGSLILWVFAPNFFSFVETSSSAGSSNASFSSSVAASKTSIGINSPPLNGFPPIEIPPTGARALSWN